MNIFKEYGLLSGYKMNINKTKVLEQNYEPSIEIRNVYNRKLKEDFIIFLGKSIPKDSSKIFKLNYRPLDIKMKSDI